MKFIESEHTYTLDESYVEKTNRVLPFLEIDEKTLSSIPFVSVTSYISKFKPKIDWNKKKREYAAKHNLTVAQVTELWDKAREEGTKRGTAHHLMRENEVINSLPTSPDTVASNRTVRTALTTEEGHKYDDLLILSPDTVYPEKMVWLPDYRLCGTADLVTVDSLGNIHIDDYKGLDIETEIPTTKGFVKLKNITKKDIIYDGKGFPTKIKNISEIHYNPCYKITFDTNDSVIADHEHRWEIDEYVSKGINKTSIYTTEELKVGMKIPVVNVEKEDIDLPIDPYILSCWLGDGSSQSGTITNMNEELWREVEEKRGYTLGPDISQGSSGKAQTKTLYGLRKKLRKLNLINNKHLPDIYLQASYNQKLDLLRGFMDTDGYWNKTRSRAVVITTKEWQAQAIHNLVNSLGWKSTIIKAKTRGFGKKDIPCFHVVFNPLENPFLTRNQDIIIKSSYFSKYRYIKSIEHIPSIPTKCIEVKSSEHTYLFSRSYIKTHNTNKKLSSRSWSGEHRNKPEYLASPLSTLENCDMSIYSLQLSLYMKMFLIHNPSLKPGTLRILHERFDENGNYTHTEIHHVNYLTPQIEDLFKYRAAEVRGQAHTILNPKKTRAKKSTTKTTKTNKTKGFKPIKLK